MTRQTFVGKVMSLVFNMLSRLVIAFLPRSKHLLIKVILLLLGGGIRQPRTEILLLLQGPWIPSSIIQDLHFFLFFFFFNVAALRS